jgi:hypothetical protein
MMAWMAVWRWGIGFETTPKTNVCKLKLGTAG